MHDYFIRSECEKCRSAKRHERHEDRNAIKSLPQNRHQLPCCESIAARTVDQYIHLFRIRGMASI